MGFDSKENIVVCDYCGVTIFKGTVITSWLGKPFTKEGTITGWFCDKLCSKAADKRRVKLERLIKRKNK